MNTMPGNPHSDDTFWDRIDSATNATLAIAHEQRTANLIALHSTLVHENSTTEAHDLLSNEINPRLGLTGTH